MIDWLGIAGLFVSVVFFAIAFAVPGVALCVILVEPGDATQDRT